MTLYRLQAKGPGAGGDFWSTSMHVESTRTIQSVHTGFESFLATFLDASILALWPNEQHCNQAVTTSITEADGKNIFQVSSAVDHVGIGTGGTISQRSATVIGMVDGTPTRAGRGRMYWPPPESTALDAQGLLTSANATLFASKFKAAVDALDVADQLVIYHRPLKAGPGGVPAARAGSTSAVTGVKVGIIIGTQRRRTNRVQNSYTTVGV